MYGLVLEGGGARGSYQAGVYKAIKEMGIEIGGVAGSSIGALNGAMIIQGDYEEFYNLWSDVSYSMLFNIEKAEVDKMRNLTLSREDIKLIGDKAKQIISHGGIDITPIKKIIDKYIDEDKIRSTNKDFGIVTVNVSEFKPIEIFLEDIPKGHLKNYLLASAYLPFFKSERLDGDIYLDGGFYDNLPFKMLFEKGYKDLILVRTHAPGITRKIELRGTNSIVISPSEDIGRTYFYDSENT
ncbi:MAG TPA: patatin-like phospholipase family protein, partial [Tissierellaceae bacterium]|nr:patatin-like phospholipase family protein [Tissierellaceae bacterium]